MKRSRIVNRKASPHPIAANLSLLFIIMILLEYSDDTLRSSEVMRSIMAVRASQRLRSVSVRGMSIAITIYLINQEKRSELFFENTTGIVNEAF